MENKKYPCFNVACGIILYQPSASVISKIEGYSRIFQKVYVFDNSDGANREEKIAWALSKMESVIYMSEGRNIGLPSAYNKILKKINNDTDYICCLDQDSIFYEKEIKRMITALRKAPMNYAVIGPHIIYHNERYVKKNAFTEKNYVITSGSFINLRLLKKNKILFDENYFIDRAEVDLDMQFRAKGGKIAEYSGACLYQQLGENGRNGKTNHSPLRHYYMFRNRFYFNHKWFRIGKRYVLNLLQTERQVFEIVKDEENKVAKLKMLPVAIRDYKKGKMGKKL